MTLAVGLVMLATQLVLAPAPDSIVHAPADSAQTLQQARRAQADFERRRFSLLPTVYSDPDRCDVRVGHYCYWDDGDDSPPPPEPAAIAPLRAQLVARLATLAAHSPTDGWIAAQRVRYLIESQRVDDAVAAARECHASAAWCASLGALALAAGPDVGAADSAVTAALAAMTPDERCAALDIEPLLDGNFRDRYRAAPCAQRDSLAARWLWLARSSYVTNGNEVRVELFVRHLMARIAAQSRAPFDAARDKDLEELVIRYGWSTAWGKTEAPIGLAEQPRPIGFGPAKLFVVAPADGDLTDPATIDDPTRLRNDPAARSRFPIRGVKTLGGLAERIAFFRRGDSTLAIAAFDATTDTAMRGVDSARASLVLLRDEHTPPVVARAVRGPRGLITAVAPWRPSVVVVELRDSASGRAARARAGAPAADSAGRVGLSDLLLFDADTIPATALDSVLARAIVDGRIAAGRKLGLFWEMYGVADDERVTATIGMVPDESGFLRRMAEKAGVATPRTPLHLRWTDAPEVHGSVGGRALTIDLADMPEGWYTVELTLAVPGQPSRRAASRVEIVSR